MLACNRSDWDTLGSRLTMPNNLNGHWPKAGIVLRWVHISSTQLVLAHPTTLCPPIVVEVISERTKLISSTNQCENPEPFFFPLCDIYRCGSARPRLFKMMSHLWKKAPMFLDGGPSNSCDVCFGITYGLRRTQNESSNTALIIHTWNYLSHSPDRPSRQPPQWCRGTQSHRFHCHTGPWKYRRRAGQLHSRLHHLQGPTRTSGRSLWMWDQGCSPTPRRWTPWSSSESRRLHTCLIILFLPSCKKKGSRTAIVKLNRREKLSSTWELSMRRSL